MRFRQIKVGCTLLLASVLLAPATGAVALDDAMIGSLTVDRLWARATPPGSMMGAVYLDISNPTREGVDLVGVTSPVAKRAEVHESVVMDGMMKMQKRESLPIGAGNRVKFEPGGLHIMLMGLAGPLNAGEEFELTLHFSNQIQLTMQVPVLPVTQLTYPDRE